MTQPRPCLTLQLTRFRDLGEAAEEEDESFLGEVVRMCLCVSVSVCACAHLLWLLDLHLENIAAEASRL